MSSIPPTCLRPAALHVAMVLLGLGPMGAGVVHAQAPIEGEVRQIVTFTFRPGMSGAALAAYRDRAVPLYRDDEAMLSFRAFREIESPIPLDLMIVRGFDGMAGMDASNELLRELAAEAGTSIGAIYGELGEMSTGHTDQFIEMLPGLGEGDPASRRLTAFVWYRVATGERAAFERALEAVLGLEREAGVRSATGRFLVSDGWDYLRMLGVESLGAYQDYWTGIGRSEAYDAVSRLTAERATAIVSSVSDLAIR